MSTWFVVGCQGGLTSVGCFTTLYFIGSLIMFLIKGGSFELREAAIIILISLIITFIRMLLP